MSLVNSIITDIRRQRTPLTRRLFRLGMDLYGIPFPVIKPLHALLYHEWNVRTALWHNFWRVVYYEPMFKSQCVHVGKRFVMEYAGNGCTKISGDLLLHIGDHVTIFDNTYFAGLKVLDHPSIYVGDHTYIGPRVNIIAGKEIRIGAHCLVISHLITDNPGHSTTDTLARLQSRGGSPEPETIRPVKIGDFCFLPQGTVVYPGVTVGDGVVARTGTHLSHDVPPFCHVVGMPGKIHALLPIPAGLKEIVGPDRYRFYLEEHQRLQQTMGLTYLNHRHATEHAPSAEELSARGAHTLHAARTGL